MPRFAPMLLLLLACTSPPPPPEPFATLQPAVFQGLALDRADALPALEACLDASADRAIALLDAGDADDAARAEAASILLYAGFLPHDGVHLLEDGFVAAAAFPDRVAAMERSKDRLTRAATLRPDDTRIPIMLRSVEYNLAVLRGQDVTDVTDAVVTAAEQDWFGLFAALALFRDPKQHPMSAAHMDRLLHIACRPDRFDCDRAPPSAGAPGQDAPAGASSGDANPPSPAPDGTLTRSIVGPVLVSDLLVRRAEFLLASGDPSTLGEVMGRLGAARGLLGYAQANVARPELAHFPATSTLAARAQRIESLTAAAGARMSGGEAPLPDGAGWYAGRAYTAVYQCSACHTYAQGQATGVPK